MEPPGLFVHQGVRATQVGSHHLVHSFPTALWQKRRSKRIWLASSRQTVPLRKRQPPRLWRGALDRSRAFVRVGDISASIWSRDHLVRGESRTFYSLTLERSFRDRDGAYRYTRSFDPDSLGSLVTAIQKADEFLRTLEESAAQ
jgi:hypothetical protein